MIILQRLREAIRFVVMLSCRGTKYLGMGVRHGHPMQNHLKIKFSKWLSEDELSSQLKSNIL